MVGNEKGSFNGNELIRVTNAFAKEDRKLSWWYTISTAAMLICTLSLTILNIPLALKILFSVVSGLLLSRMFVIYHDYQHKSILKNSILAHVLMNLLGLLVLTPKSVWLLSHDHHHNHNSKLSDVVLGSFPVITKRQFTRLTPRQKIKYRIFRHPLIIVFAYIPVFLVSFCIYPFLESPKKHFDCGVAVLFHVLLIGVVLELGGWIQVFLTIFFPLMILCAIGAYIFYAQHNFPGLILKEGKEWSYLDAALKSSSYIRMNKIMRWFTANIGYHHIHHANSKIPFYRLRETMSAVEEFQSPRETTLRPRDILQCLNLKLWDPELNRMITWAEYRRDQKYMKVN